jgi:hypothetical protein
MRWSTSLRCCRQVHGQTQSRTRAALRVPKDRETDEKNRGSLETECPSTTYQQVGCRSWECRRCLRLGGIGRACTGPSKSGMLLGFCSV